MNIVGALGWIVLYFLIGLFLGGLWEDKNGNVNTAVMCFWPLYVAIIAVTGTVALVCGLVIGIVNVFRK